MAICKLCSQNKKLCKSHIIPEWCYANCYDENHSFIQFNGNKDAYNSTKFKGIYDKLLCKSCEVIIQQYEDYGKCLIDQTKVQITDNGFVKKNYNYKKFKLFILSILWRASISSRPEYKQVHLGKYEKQIKDLLLSNSITEESYFPVLLSYVFNGEKPAKGVFVEPSRRKMKNNQKTLYLFLIDGFLICIGVGDFSTTLIAHKNSLTREFFAVGVIKNIQEIPEFLELYDRLEEQGKFSTYKKLRKRTGG